MKRSEQKKENTWNLEAMYLSDEEWFEDYESVQKRLILFEAWQGRLKDHDSLLGCLADMYEIVRQAEKIGIYASLRFEADASDGENARLAGLVSSLDGRLAQATSWVEPEILAIPEEKLNAWIMEEDFSDYRNQVMRIIREKEHILDSRCEHILALNSESGSACQEAFHDLNDIDLDFGYIGDEKLTHGSWSAFMISKDENVRKEAYGKYYAQYEAHSHVLARLYAGSVNQDIFLSRSRGYSSSLEASLFPDKVSTKGYRNLIDTVHSAFPILHRYYSVRARLLGKEKLRHYDVYVPMVENVEKRTAYDEAVSIIEKALSPLGDEYTSTLVKGLTRERWVDRYENEGKRSGAFSSGGYDSIPYILTNYRDDVLSSIFTLAHEGGHSMHTWYSTHNNPYPDWSYSIFEAEVASTFNEELLSHYLIENGKDENLRRYLVAKRLDDIVATLFRQTMFAEFELLVHEEVEKGGVATLDWMRGTYRKLLEDYFGPSIIFEETSDLECLRIPHFYNAFYVYKYATGISAAIALTERVLAGGEKERDEYIGFLKRGGSRYPIDNLRLAGVDMEKTESVQSAIDRFSQLLDSLA